MKINYPIEFSRHLSESQVKDMFREISKKGKYEVKIEVAYIEKLNNRVEKIYGEIYEKDRLTNPVFFHLNNLAQENSKEAVFNKLEFETIPGYKTEANRNHEHAQWVEIQSEIKSYFNNLKKLKIKK